MQDRTAFVDVDDTLIRSVGAKRIPMAGVIAKIRRLKADGACLYLWSSGGAEYARASAVELGLEGCSTAFLPKSDLYIDDQPVHEWCGCGHVSPGRDTELDPVPWPLYILNRCRN